MKKIIVVLSLFITLLTLSASAQSVNPKIPFESEGFKNVEDSQILTSPPPPTAPKPVVITYDLADFLLEMLVYLVTFKNHLVKIIDPLIGYFQYLSYLVLIIVTLTSLYKRAESGFDLPELFKFAAWISVGFLLISLCGDVDRDGKRGDIVNNLTTAGKNLAYGTNGDRLGVYLSQAIEQRRKSFDDAFLLFTENKLMVKIDNRDMPIEYPGGDPQKILIALQSKKDFTKSDVESQVERMSWYLSLINTGRALIHGADIFLMMVNVFLVLGTLLVTPLMFAFLPDENWRKKITYSYLWSFLVLAFVYPLFVQTVRFLIFAVAEFGVGINNENPFFRYDATTKSFIANGNPEPFIWIAISLMAVSLFIFVMSLVLSWKLLQGSFLESVAGIASSALATQVAAGLGIGTSIAAQRKASEARETELEGNRDAEYLRADYMRQTAMNSAESGKRVGLLQGETSYQTGVLTAQSERESSQMKNQAGLENSAAMAEIERVSAAQNTFANLQRSWRTADKDAKVNSLMNSMEYAAANGDATMKEMVDRLNLVKDKKELLGKMVDEDLAGAGFFGKLANVLGLEGKTYQSWAYGKGGSFGESFVERYLENKGSSPEEIDQTMAYYKGATADEQSAMVGMILGDKKATESFNNSIGERLQSAKADLGSLPFQNSDITPTPLAMRGIAGMNKRQKENYAAMFKMINSDPNFLSTIERESLKRNINPNDMLNLIAIESSFNKTASNPYGYIGLGQVGRSERQSLGWSGNDAVDIARLKNMSPSEQLSSLVFPFVDTKMRENPALRANPSMARLYSAWGDGKATFDDNRIIKTSSGQIAAPGTKKYDRNRSWDQDGNGIIQQKEFGAAAYEKLGAGVHFSYGDLMSKSRRSSTVRTSGGNGFPSSNSGGFSVPYTGGNISSFGKSAIVAGGTNRSMQIPSYSTPLSAPSAEIQERSQTNLGEFVNKGMTQMQQLTPAQAEVFGKEMASRAEAIHSFQKNSQIYKTKEASNSFQNQESKAIEYSYAQAMEQSAMQKQKMQLNAAQNFFYSNEAADNVLYNAKMQSADINRKANFVQTMDTYKTGVMNADLGYKSSIESANIIHNAQLKALQQNNVSRLIENIGGTVSRQVSELFEKAGRF